jgi:hypothetical protein
MYTTAQSIENKVGGLSGWKDLLQAVGFRFEPSLNGLPPAVFFPQSDPGDRLTQASASLQALLGNILVTLYMRDIWAEWLRSLTSNHLPLTAVGSKPDRDFGFFHVRKLSS